MLVISYIDCALVLLIFYRRGSRISSQGGALKKIAPSGERRENFWGISFEKSRFYAKKLHFFQFYGVKNLPPPPKITKKQKTKTNQHTNTENTPTNYDHIKTCNKCCSIYV